jgi:hypothetical protein
MKAGAVIVIGPDEASASLSPALASHQRSFCTLHAFTERIFHHYDDRGRGRQGGVAKQEGQVCLSSEAIVLRLI